MGVHDMNAKRVFFSSILAWGAFAASATAAFDGARVDSLFFRGVEAYQNGKPEAALRTFEALDREFPNHDRSTASLLMQGKSLDRMGEAQRALEAFQELIRDYPRSAYVDDARYGLAVVYVRQGAAREALLELMTLLSTGGSKPLLAKAEKLAADVTDACFSPAELRDFIREVPEEKAQAFIVLRIGRQEIRNRQFQSAREILDAFLREHPRNAYAQQMETLRSRAESLGKGTVKLGVILPLSGNLADQGKAVLAGIRYAVARQNAKSQLQAELLVKDSEGNMIRAIQAAQEVSSGEDVSAVIGDLESHVTEVVAAVTQENDIPLIAPTAMEDGLVKIGANVFQLNGTLADRAATLAEYAVKGLGLRRFAMFYPADAYGREMRKAFVETVNRLGGEILVEKWFFEGTEDFNPAFNAMREAGLRQMISDSIAAANPGKNLDLSKQFIDRKAASLLDEREIAITSIDAILALPGRDKLETIVSMLQYHNIRTQILGNASWDDPAFLTRRADVLDGAVYYSDFYMDPLNPETAAFIKGYTASAGKPPDRMEATGYDAASVVLDAMGGQSLSRQDLRDRLAEVQHYAGVRGAVSFQNNRVNPAFRLLQFREGKIIVIR
jgi:ABC-type branched-subunit amino acid transport system substrate-binding protein